MADTLNNTGLSTIGPPPPDTTPPPDTVDIKTPPAVQPGGGGAAQDVPRSTAPATVNKGFNWGQNVASHILSALSGGPTITYKRDPDTGQMQEIKTPTTRGEQWKRIIAGFLAGVGNADLTPGPGQMGRAFSTGTKGGMQFAQQREKRSMDLANEDYELQQKALVQKAQLSMMNLQITSLGLQNKREEVNASFEDAQRHNEFLTKYVTDGGGTDLGTFPDFKSVLDAHQQDPKLLKAFQQGLVLSIPEQEGGAYKGMHFVLTTPEWGKQRTTKDIVLNNLKPPDHPGGPWTLDPQTIKAGSMSNEDAYKYSTAANTEYMKYDHDQNEAKKEENRAAEQRRRDDLMEQRLEMMGRRIDQTEQEKGAQDFVVPGPNGTRNLVRVYPGQQVPAGAMTAQQFGTLSTPTQQMRNAGYQAKFVHQMMPQTLSLLDEIGPKEFGPVAGRWHEFRTGSLGLKDDKFYSLNADLTMMASAVALAHARGRLPENLRNEFMNIIDNPKQNYQNLKAGLQRIDTWMEANADLMDMDYQQQNGVTGPQPAPTGQVNVKIIDPKTGQIQYGQVAKGQLDQFLKDHKGASVQ